jgi:large subunit ribosomal protein L6
VSRIGSQPVTVPDGVKIELSGRDVAVSGKLGGLSMVLVEGVAAVLDESQVVVTPRDDTRRARAMWGMQRTLLNNMVTGVSQGFKRELDIVGVGYRAAVEGTELTLQLGYSHPVHYPIPDGISISCERPTKITIEGIDKQRVGQVAAEIRAFRKPEPYKGKGIRYADEIVHRKEGKKK